MGYSRQIHNLLDAAFGKHGKPGLSGCHDIRMVAEDADGVCANNASTDMKYAWQQLTGDFIHVGNHQQQTLRGRIGSSQRPCLQRTVDSTSRAAFRLHFNDFNSLSEDIFLPLCRPGVNMLSHV